MLQGQDASSTSDVKYPGLYKPGQGKAAAAAAPATGSSDVQYPGLYKPNKPLKVSKHFTLWTPRHMPVGMMIAGCSPAELAQMRGSGHVSYAVHAYPEVKPIKCVWEASLDHLHCRHARWQPIAQQSLC